MKNRRKYKHTKQAKRFYVIYDPKYKAASEASPYNDWREAGGDVHQEHEAEELPEANPDILPEDAGIYYHEPEVDENQLDLIKQSWDKLTKKQQRVLQLVAYEGKTMESAGAILGISRHNVSDIIERARKIILSGQVQEG